MKRIFGLLFGLLLISQSLQAATYLVTNTYDSGTGTLRQAILDANANAGKDIINFNFPGAGPHIITLSSALPNITEQITINGYSQPQSFAGTSSYPAKILCVVDFNFMNNSGFVFTFASGTSDISGLSIVNATGGNSAGIYLNNCAITNITGNMIGLYPDESAGGNYVGIHIAGTDNAVIGGSDANRNIISYNSSHGILIENIAGNEATGATVSFNYIGTDATGLTDLGNMFDGIHIAVCDNSTITRNIISGNGGNGIYLNGTGSNSLMNTTISNNKIGVNKANISLSNSLNGILLNFCQNTNIGGSAGLMNVIANNEYNGILITGEHTSTGNNISNNSIYLNTLLGIDLNNDGVTANDAGDPDNGPNGLQNYPVVDSAVMNGSNLTVYGKFNGTAGAPVRLEFFNNPQYITPLDLSGYGEGYTSIGTLNVTGTGSDATFTFTASGFSIYNDYITATATNTTTNNTSEFSIYKQISSNKDYVCDDSGPFTHTYTINNVPGATSYLWTVDGGASITSGQGTTSADVNWNGVAVGNYTVCVNAVNDCGSSNTSCFPVVVKHCCSAPIVNNSSVTVCNETSIGVILPTSGTNGATITKYDISSVITPGLFGTASTGTNITDINYISSNLFTNATNSSLTVTYTIVPYSYSCVGNSFTITVTINPIPTLTNPESTTVCDGNATNIALVTTITSPTVLFTWTVVGSSGNVSGYSSQVSPVAGPIIQNLINIGTTNETVTYTITPVTGSCSGNSRVVTVTVYPTPTVIATPASQTLCTGSTSGINLSTTITGQSVVFSWTAAVIQGTASGFSAGNGLNITQTLTNTGNVQAIVRYAITPYIGSCNGTPVMVDIIVNPCADVSIMKTDSPNPVMAGSNLTYTLVVTNNGPSIAQGVLITDNLPAEIIGATFSVNAGPSNLWTGSYNAGSIGSGSTTTVVITGSVSSSVPDGTLLTNTATVSSATSDPNLANNSSSVNTTVKNSADLSIIKTGTPDPVVAGQQLTYTITVTNNGPSDAQSVSVNEVLPAGLSLVSATPSAGSWTSPSWIIGTLANGNSATLVIVSSVNSDVSQGSNIVNTATVASTTPDPNPGNNSSTKTTMVNSSADLNIVKTSVPDPVIAGQQLTYTITVTNNGPSDAQSVSVNDVLPAGLSIISTTVSHGSWTYPVWTIGAIANSGNATITIVASVNTNVSAGTVLNNTATVTSSTPDPVPGNNTSTVTNTVSATADLYILKTSTPDPVIAGNNITYTIAVTNFGPSDAQNVNVSDVLPAGLTLVSATPSAGTWTSPGWTVGSLALNASANIVIVATVSSDAADGSILSNTAVVTSTTTDPNPGNNSSTETSNVITQSDLAITKTDSPDPVLAGQNVTYTINVSNSGPSAAHNVNVNDVLPSELTIVSALPSIGSWTAPNWTIGSMNPGASASLVIVAYVNSDVLSASNINNTATVSSSTNDVNPANNSASASTLVNASADLDIVKTCTTSPVIAGQPIEFNLTLVNNGPSDAQSIIISDVVPANISNVIYSPDGGSSWYTWSGTFTTNNLEEYSTITILLKGDLSTDATGNIINTATVSSTTSDPVPANNTSTSTTPVTTSADLAASKICLTTPVVGGLAVVYRIIGHNFGPSDAQDVILSDVMSMPNPYDAGTTEYSTDNGVSWLPWPGSYNAGTILHDGTVSILVRGVLIATSPPNPLPNTVDVTSTTSDPNLVNNTFSINTPTNELADLAIVKSCLTSPVVAGEQINYSLVVTNYGASTAIANVNDFVDPDIIQNTEYSINGGLNWISPWPENISLGLLNPAASATILIRGTVKSGILLPIVNTSLASSPTPDPDLSNNSSTVTSPVTQSADLSLVKTDSPDPVIAGAILTYTLTVTNNGPSDARLISIADNVPGSLSNVEFSINNGSTWNPWSSPYNDGDLPVSNSMTILIRGKVNSNVAPGSTIINTATVSSSTSDPVPANNTSAAGTLVNATADLAITKTVAPEPVYAGQTLTYTISVHNNGPSDALNVAVADIIPAGLSLVSATPSTGSWTSPNWTIGTIANGTSVSMQIVTLVNSNVAQATIITNTAIVSSTTPDPNAANNSSSVNTNVEAQADLAITKIGLPNPGTAGSMLTYTITVTNNGPSDAQLISVTDILPAGLTIISATPSVGLWNSPIWSVGTISNGSSVSLVIQTTINSNVPTGTTLSNTTTVTSHTTDPNPVNNTATENTPVNTNADLAITKIALPSPVFAGNSLTYTINIVNNGPSDALNVVVNDLLPVGLSLVSANPAVGTWSGSQWTIGTLVNGASSSITLVTTVSPDLANGYILTNTATISSTTPDPVPANNTSTVNTTVNTSADLVITKSDSPDPVIAGQNVTYTITVTNNGPSDAQNSVVTDALPAGLSIISATPSVGVWSSPTWTIGTIANGTSANIIIVAHANSNISNNTVVNNTATVVSSTSDPIPANNSATEPTTVIAEADLLITKTVSPDPVYSNNNITYSIVVTNNGPSDAQSITVHDVLPSNLTFVSATPSGGSWSAPDWTFSGLVVGTSASITIVARVNNNVQDGTVITNTATVSCITPDPILADNTDNESTTVVTSADITIVKTASPDPVTPGNVLIYTITVNNMGPSSASDIQVNDVLAASILNPELSTDGGTTWTPWINPHYHPILDNGVSFSILIRGIVAPSTCGSISNSAFVSSSTSDPSPANNNSTITTAVSDNITPNITCPANYGINGCNTNVITGLAYSETDVSITLAQLEAAINGGGTASDNCSFALSYKDSKTGINPIIVSRSFTITDLSGNTNTCVQTITITCCTNPTIDNILATACSGATIGVSLPVTGTNASPVTRYDITAIADAGLVGTATTGNSITVPNAISGDHFTNSTNNTLKVVYTVIPWSGICQGDPFNITVTINPVPTLVDPTDITICNGTSTNISLSSTIILPAVTYTWTAVGSSINIIGYSDCSASCGTSINQILVNSGITTETVTYTITPYIGTCAGILQTVVVTVNPAPQLNNPADVIKCSGEITNISVTTPITGPTVSYTWTGALTSGSITGFGSGSGSHVVATLINTANSSGVVTYTITPHIGSCIGINQIVDITVNPVPTIILTPVNQTVCQDGMFTITASNPNNVPGTSYTWTRSDNPFLSGLPLSGSGNILIGDFTSSEPQIAHTETITFTAEVNGCSSNTDATVTVLDNIAPSITCPANYSISGCNTSDITGLVYSESDVSISLAQFETSLDGGGTASDNCNFTLKYKDSNSGICPVIVTRIFTVTDAGGNTSSCTQTITIEHNSAPVTPVDGSSTVSCIADAIIPTPPVVKDMCGTLITPVLLSTVDNPDPIICGGTRTYTWTYTDCSWITANWNYVYTIIDNITPSISSCGPMQSAIANSSSQAVVPDFTSGIITTDNCTASGSLIITQSPVAGTLVGPGVNNITITVTDACGNPTICSNTFTVTSLSISGNVFDDANGMVNGAVDGLLNYAGNTLFANLVDANTNLTVAVTQVLITGSFEFYGANGYSNYKIILSDIAGTVGNPPPVHNLPSPWINTGEHIGLGAGSDGIADGTISVTTTNVDVANVIFGIEQPPAVFDYTMNPQFNPGGNVQITIPALAFSGSDAEDGAYPAWLTGKNVILYPASNGTLYYTGTAVLSPLNIAVFNPTLASVDPNTGNLAVTFNYTTFDNANIADPTPNTITIPFFDVLISGNIFDDGNGLINGIVDGSGTNMGGTLFINLVNATTGNVFAVLPVNPDGSYMFTNIGIPSNTNFNLVLSTTSGVPGNPGPAAVLPANWVNTGEHLGTDPGSDGTANGILSINTSGASFTQCNFAIDQLPQTTNASATYHNPGGTITMAIPALSGSDFEDGVYGTGMSFEVKTIPANGVLYYNGTPVVVGQVITAYNPALLTIDPLFDGSGNVNFIYTAIDAAGKQDPTPASVTINFTGINLYGNVYDDANGLLNGTVDGIPTNAGGTLFANLVDGNTGLVIGINAVTGGGTYQFLNLIENSNYTIILSSIAGTIGAAAPTAILPSPWLNTGENNGSGPGNDMAVNGIINVQLLNIDIFNVNFGIENPPAVADFNGLSQINPGGFVQISVPPIAFSGTDFEDGIYPLSLSGRHVELSPATNGILYYLGIPVLTQLNIPGFNPNMVTIDPIDGNATVTFSYTTDDNAGIPDATPGNITMTFTGITVSGNVLNDANGLVNNIVDGIGTNISGSLFMSLVNAGSGKVVAVVPVNTDGSYLFSGPSVALNSNFNLILSTIAGMIGNPAPIITLPVNWVNTGEHVGLNPGNDGAVNGLINVNTLNSDISNANFGLDQLPNSNNVFAAYMNPGVTTTVSIPALSGTDPEDGILGIGSSFIISTIPANGNLFYDGITVVAGQQILNYNPALLVLDPLFNGSGSVVFSYATLDAAGKQDPTPAIVTINFYMCANSVVVPTNQAQCGAVVFNIDPQPPLGTITYSMSGATTGNGSGTASGHFFNVGVTTVTYTITDTHGNVMTCSFTVTVNDLQPPTITCPANITVNNTPSLCSGVATYNVTFSDNCPGSTLVQLAGLPSGAIFPVGTTTNIFRVTDAYGNSATCTFTVTVNDIQAPTISCPANISKAVDPAHCFATISIPAPIVNDNCGVASVINNITGTSNANGTFGVGTTTIIWTVTDTHGNTATCSMNVVIYDNEIPTLVCPTNVTKNTNPGQCQATVLIPPVMKSDNCGIASVVNSQNGTSNASGVYPVGTTNVIWTATDIHGNTATCMMTVTVIDNQNPTIVCPANITQANTSGLCNAIVNVPIPVTSDNCGVSTLVNSFNNTGNASGIYPVGNTFVTWTVTDIHGNTASCSMTIKVIDTQIPVITCPASKTVNTDFNSCTATGVLMGTPVTSDNCGIASVTNNAPVAFPKGLNTVTWIVTDTHGNTASCLQTVLVVDNQNPSITCPVNLTVNNTTGNCQATGLSLGIPVASDNCPGLIVTNNAPSVYPLGNTTVTWTATDATGLTATCNQTVTVADNQLPTIVCPANITANADAGQCSATGINPGNPVTSDNCPGTLIITNNAPASYPVGQTIVTWSVTDVAGHSSTCTQTITVIDNQPPSITCPPNLTVNNNSGVCGANGVNLGTAITYDNCGVLSTTSNAPAIFAIGTTSVTWVVTDNHGNSATCTQLVLVVDDQAPVITCPSDITVNNSPGQCGATGVNPGTPLTADNCSVASVVNNAPSFYPVGVTTIVWTATDAFGNTASCNQTITVIENTPPVIGSTIPVIAQANNGCSATGVILIPPIVTDNCQVASLENNGTTLYQTGITTVTWTATDIHGNVSTATQLVTVLDVTPPVIVCPGPITLNTDPGLCTASNTSIPLPTAYDECSGVTVTNNAPGVLQIGTSTITWIVTDASGNTATCESKIYVVDNQIPTISCPGNILQVENTNVVINPPIVSDNCGIASVVNSHNGTNNASGIYPPGTTTVTWTVIDINGNTATCSHNITITCLLHAFNDTATIAISDSAHVHVVQNDSMCGVPVECTNITILIHPSNFTVHIDTATGAIICIPLPGFVGIDSLQYEICCSVIDQLPLNPNGNSPAPNSYTVCATAWLFIRTVALPSAIISGSAVICQGGTATALVGLTGVPPYQVKITDGTNIWTYSGVMSNILTIPLNPTTTKTYHLVSVKDATGFLGTTTGSATITVNVINNYVITGGGNYCPGAAGVIIGLTGSDIGAYYQLYRNNVAIGSVVSGTGMPLSFGYQTGTGLYSVIASSGLNGCSKYMSGNTIINKFPEVSVFNVTGGGECCFGCTDVHIYLSGSVPGVNYNLWLNGTTLVSTLNGTGSALDFGYMTAGGYYTISGTNAYGCTAFMNGAAVIILHPKAEGELVSADATICQGQDISLVVDLTSGSGPWTIVVSNGSGNVTYDSIWCSPFIFTVTPGSTRTYTLISVSDAYGCLTYGSGSTTINVLPIPTVTHLSVASVCENSLPFGLTGGSPAGGFYMGPGIVNGVFNPGLSGAGSFDVLYTVSSGNGCHASATVTITVNALPTVSATLLNPVYCQNAATVTLIGNHAPEGTFSGPGITNNGNGSATFSPIIAGEGGPYAISYSYTNNNGCPATSTQMVAVTGNGTGCSIGAQSIYCLSNTNYPIYGFPSGGVLSGPGVVNGNQFNPSLAGFGTHTLIYSVNQGGCVNIATQFIQVTSTPQEFVITGGGHYCAGNAGVEIGLNGSQTGITYTLLRDNIPTTQTMNGTGTSITFGYQTIEGTYTISARQTGSNCESQMIGIAVVTMNPLPVVILDTIPVICITADPIILTQGYPDGGIYSGAGITNNLFEPAVAGYGDIPIIYTYTDQYHCSNSASNIIRVDSCGFLKISGNVIYGNTVGTPLNNASIALKRNGVVIQNISSNIAGHYEFTHVIPGTYTIEATCSKAWGGVNASDALLIMKHFIHIHYLSGLPKVVADVDGNGYINAIDALMVSKRFTNLISSFANGDWKFASQTVTVTTSDVSSNIIGLCVGDVNTSYLPPSAMTQPTIELGHAGSINVQSFDSFELPIVTRTPLYTGAVSMIIDYPENLLEVMDVKMQGNENIRPVFNSENGELRIAWYNEKNPLELNDGDILFTIHFKTKDLKSLSEGYIDLELDGSSEIANNNADVIRDIQLVCPKLTIQKPIFNAIVLPNPVQNEAKLVCSLPEDGFLSIQLFDMTGNLVKILADRIFQNAGNYTTYIDANILPAGLYTSIIILQTEDKFYQTVNKLIISKK